MNHRIVLGALTAVFLSGPMLAEGARTIIVMDGSGSMWGQIEGRAKLEIARDTVGEVLATIPPAQELGLMAYGHREKGNCSDIELLVRPASGTGGEIAAKVGQMRFLGKTPLSEAVRQAAVEARHTENAATVVLVTDGLETCEADPCAVARELEAAGLNFTAHVIGFGLSGAEGAQVACIATETGGQYFEARDAAGLAGALSASVKAELPPPQPVPEPEAAPVLPTAILTAPDSAPAGTEIEVSFSGPHEEFDYIRVLDANQDRRSEAAVGIEPKVTLRVPFETGPHELVYLYKGTEIIARRPLEITEAPVSITAPDTAPAGSRISVSWTGPNAEYDYLTMFDASGARVSEYKTGSEAQIEWQMPWLTGDFTLSYLFNGQDVVFSRPITLTEGVVEVSAPELAQVGSDVTVTWQGPNAQYDNIQLYAMPADDRVEYQYLGDTNQLVFSMPDVPGTYEFRYRFQDSQTIYTRPITVTLDKVDAAIPKALTIVPVKIRAEPEFADVPIMWSAEPLEPHPAAPEALAMPEAQVGDWQADLYAGRWRIYGEPAADAPTAQIAAQGFAGEIVVSDGQGQEFDIALAPFETTGMGEDAPGLGGPVPLLINGEYEGIRTRWQASPASGQDSPMLASDFVQGGWQTALDPGRWLIEGFADGGDGHLYAGVIDVAPDSGPKIILARTASAAANAAVLPSGDAAKAVCAAQVACYSRDAAGGLSYLLLPDWAASAALFYETAAGVTAPVPSVDFYTGAPLQVMAALNPRQWDASLGPCSDTVMGPLCAANDADPAAVALLRASITPLPPAASIEGAAVDLTPEAASALRALLQKGTP